MYNNSLKMERGEPWYANISTTNKLVPPESKASSRLSNQTWPSKVTPNKPAKPRIKSIHSNSRDM